MSRKKIKVLQVFDSLEISGGVQSVIMNMLRSIDREKVQIDFAVYDAPPIDTYEQEVKKLGVRIFKVKNISEAGVFGFYKQFFELFKENHYDAVHAHNLLHNGIILLAAKKNGIKNRISHSHQSFDDRNNKFPRNFIAFFFKKLGLLTATKLVACSDLAAKFLFGKNKDYVFLPNALEIEKFDIEKSESEIRKSFGINDISTHILTNIGRFTFQKNQFFLLKIMDKLRTENCILLMAGQGELREEFFETVKKENLQDKIKYLGLIENIPELLKVSDCLLLPSTYEGLPVVGVEAQAAGCFSIISNTITKQADLGLGLVEYLPIADPEPWVEKIKNIISNPKKTVSYEDVKQQLKRCKFENQSNIDTWKELYGMAK